MRNYWKVAMMSDEMLATDSGKPSIAKQAMDMALSELADERSQQVTDYSIGHDDNHGPGDWLVLIRDDLRKAEAAWICGKHDEYLRRLRYIGALSLAATEREMRARIALERGDNAEG